MTRRSGRALLAGALLALAALAHAGSELRLLMFEADDCEFCARWNEEVGVIYGKTDEGRRAPLQRVAIEVPQPVGLVEPVRYTPTFVLWGGGSELGRITGYPGEDHFWGLLGRLLDDVEPAPVPGATAPEPERQP